MSTNRTPIRLAALAVAAPLGLAAAAAPAAADEEVPRPASFTSAYTVMATPDTIIDAEGASVPGEEGATGTFTFMVNSDEDVICYDITLTGVTGEYESPARTATHIHAAPAGQGDRRGSRSPTRRATVTPGRRAAACRARSRPASRATTATTRAPASRWPTSRPTRRPSRPTPTRPRSRRAPCAASCRRSPSAASTPAWGAR
ncbi:CHRD domain-containing protein [Nocardioides zeae]